MILFKCQKCGAVLEVQDECTDTSVACTYCGTDVSIPAQSDPACVLIFTEESPSTGTPMTEAELNIRLAEGTVRPHDLIWIHGIWQPLNTVYELPPEPPSTPPAGVEQVEIATRFTELEPVDGPEAPTGRKRKSSRGNARTDNNGGWSTQHSLSPVKILGYAVALAVLAVAAYFGLRIFNAATGQTAALLCFNSSVSPVHVSIPWAQKDLELTTGQSSTIKDIALVFSTTRELKISTGNNGLTEASMETPLAPKCVTVVNLGGTPLPVVDPAFSPEHLDAAMQKGLPELLQQLEAGEAPAFLLEIGNAVSKVMQDETLETIPNACLSEQDYCLDLLLKSLDGDLAPKHPHANGDTRPYIFPANAVDLQSPATKATYRLKGSSSWELLEANVPVDDVSMKLLGRYDLTGGASLHISHPAPNELTAMLQCDNVCKDSCDGMTFNGKWRYTAHCSGTIWEWRWELVDRSGKVRIRAEKGKDPVVP